MQIYNLQVHTCHTYLYCNISLYTLTSNRTTTTVVTDMNFTKPNRSKECEGRTTCRLYRKAPNAYNNDSCWTHVYPIVFTQWSDLLELVYGVIYRLRHVVFLTKMIYVYYLKNRIVCVRIHTFAPFDAPPTCFWELQQHVRRFLLHLCTNTVKYQTNRTKILRHCPFNILGEGNTYQRVSANYTYIF